MYFTWKERETEHFKRNLFQISAQYKIYIYIYTWPNSSFRLEVRAMAGVFVGSYSISVSWKQSWKNLKCNVTEQTTCLLNNLHINLENMNKVSQKLVLYFKPDSQVSPEKIPNQRETNRSVLNVTKIYSLGFHLNLKVAQNNFSKIKETWMPQSRHSVKLTYLLQTLMMLNQTVNIDF